MKEQLQTWMRGYTAGVEHARKSMRWQKPSQARPKVGEEVCVMSERGLIQLAKMKKNGAWVTTGRKSHPIKVLKWCEVNYESV